jgi:hypothetical protein
LLALLASLLLSLALGCSDVSPVLDGPPADLSSGESIRPPDFRVDGRADLSGNANIGAPCDPATGGAECKGGTVCLDIQAGRGTGCVLATGMGCGICALSGCVVEDVQTPELEDTCPEVSVGARFVPTICTMVPLARGEGGAESATFCLPSCTPHPDVNACADYGHAGVSCDPGSVTLTGQSEVCLYPTCTEDADCDNPDPLEPRATCHIANGLCLTVGNPEGAIGSPCVTSVDCGRYQRCLHEQQGPKGDVQFEGGYCTLVGCEHFIDEGTTPYWQCPEGSKCVLIGSAKAVSLCLAFGCKIGAPKESDGCRDDASAGQYSCVKVDDPELGVCWLDVSPKE